VASPQHQAAREHVRTIAEITDRRLDAFPGFLIDDIPAVQHSRNSADGHLRSLGNVLNRDRHDHTSVDYPLAMIALEALSSQYRCQNR
jgi:hypothetical protein